jgi:guanylate kinase
METSGKGHLFIISGPSGTGKGTICAGLLQSEKVALSVSMTTRAPRAHEVEGKSYYFVDKERFMKALAEGELCEHAEIYGEYYGTPLTPVKTQLEKGIDVILEIDVNGAIQVRERMPEAILVFIMPPSPEELKRRIEGRGTETAERIAKRLERSDSEIAQAGKYDYCVVNNDIGKAIDDVLAIMEAERGIPSSRADELRIKDNIQYIIKRYHEGSLE